MSLSNNTFCWHGIVSTDTAKTLAFFPEVLGWTVQEIDMGGDKATMFANAGKPLAHVRGPAMDAEPGWWNNYLRVADVDGVAAAVTKGGGKVVVPPNDIPPGRFATVATPSGAHFSLFCESNSDDTDSEPATGNIHWVDLHSKDLEADLEFIHGALGLETREMPMPAGAYHIINPDGKTRAGAMVGQNPDAPSMWLAWVEVESVDETTSRVERHGGKLLAPAWDAQGVGRMAIASDPTGVVFGLITPPAK